MTDNDHENLAALIVQRLADSLDNSNEVAVLQHQVARQQQDLNNAHELLRSHTHTQQLLVQQMGRLETALEPLARVERLLNDSDSGLVVRQTKTEEKVKLHDTTIGSWSNRTVTAILGALGALALWIWERINHIGN